MKRTRWTRAESAAFGARLRSLREASGLSQRQMCEGTTITAAYASRIEKGERYPSVVVIRELAAKIGVTADHLEFGTDAPATVCAKANADAIDRAALRFGTRLRWDDLVAGEREQVTRGLDEALVDTLVARLYVIEKNRQLAEASR